MADKKLELNSDVHVAEIDRALELTAQVWETSNISVEDMCAQLDAIGDIVEGNSTFGDFCEATELTGCERLN
jgi:hypothetical protein